MPYTRLTWSGIVGGVQPEKRRIHLAKTLTWRVLATATTMLIAFAITGSIAVGATIGGIEACAKMVLYYGHERAWAVGLTRWRTAELATHGPAESDSAQLFEPQL